MSEASGRSALRISHSTLQHSTLNRMELTNVPKHIAIIMDGNGRWATQRGLPRIMGHQRGYQTVKKIIRAADDLGISVVTLYTFSSENWKRPEAETSAIMELIRVAAKAELPDMQEKGVRLVLSGRVDELPPATRAQLLENVQATKNNTGVVMNLAVNYGGRGEIVDAAKKLARKAADGDISPDDIEEETFAEQLYSPQLPDPDLLIRTAGEMRVSNFLLWEIAYAEIWVTKALWPDFSRRHLLRAIEDYQKRKRKFGGVVSES